jgi:hypothetical protein
MGHVNLHSSTRNNCLRFVDKLGEHVPIVHWHALEDWSEAILDHSGGARKTVRQRGQRICLPASSGRHRASDPHPGQANWRPDSSGADGGAAGIGGGATGRVS